ncbi:replication protein RepA [Stutzerimonas stutzeri]|uniref:Replication protein RepA n=1 Tax=Stutzerimonas stutzeri TaxID=316 RepID=A0AA42KV29_STUST|nr:plasmid replication protein, CyRepA1 family [Stutzerimonas stutzeri]MDH0145183.1 replication protein RepA [Stutzerimonas stutzeri]MDH0149562.1 replication protein RepA [Stutzerimonas stutzeri]
MNTLNIALNAQIPGFETVETKDVLEAAQKLRSEFPQIKRVIGIDNDVTVAIDAAYKTGSGIAQQGAVIADSIYKLRKLDIAMLIASNDSSDNAIHRAAYEVARDVYISGDIAGKALMLAIASGRSEAECHYLIARKLEKMQGEIVRRTERLSCSYKGMYEETPASAQEIFEEIITRPGKTLVQAPTGYGKTSEIIDPLIRASLADGLKVLIISHRRSINRTLATGISGVISYDECTHPAIIKNAQAIKIVVNSLAAEKFQDFIKSVDVVIIDEASQVISHVLGGEVKDRERVWDTLNFVVKNASEALLADADINARCVELVGQIHRFFSVSRDHSDITVKTGDLEHVRGLAIEAAAAGEPTLIAIDGAKSAKALAHVIQKRTGVEPLVITSESAKWVQQAAFIADPNNTEHQVVIYSPVITSSLSITSGHFKKHFGLFSGQVVPSDAIQMLRRDRTAVEFIVGLKNPEYSKSEVVDVKYNRVDASNTREAIEAAQIDNVLKETLLEALEKDTGISAFESLQYEHLSAEAWLRDNVQNTLPATLLDQGFKVEVLKHDDELALMGFRAESQGRKAVNAAAAEKVLASKALSEIEVARVKDQGSSDEAEHIRSVRAKAEKVIGRTDLTAEDAKVWKEGEGEGAIKRFRKLMSSQADKSESEAKVYSIIATVVHGMTTTSDWTSEDSAKAFDSLNEIRHDVIRTGLSIGKAATPKAKQAAMTKILGQLGLKTKKREGATLQAKIAQLQAQLEEAKCDEVKKSVGMKLKELNAQLPKDDNQDARFYYFIITSDSMTQMMTYIQK